MYAEALIPLVGPPNRRRALERLELTLAGRYSEYSDFGDTVNPRVGILWSPAGAWLLRGSYSTSFRAPSLFEVQQGDEFATLRVLDDAGSPTGETLSITRTGGNPELQEETADSFTAGIVFQPSTWSGLRIELGYFDIEYDDRIDVPGSFDNLLLSPDVYAPFITRNPSAAEVASLTSLAGFRDFHGQPFAPSDVGAIVDQRRQNIAAVTVNGVDLYASIPWQGAGGDWTATLEGTYLLQHDERLTALTSEIERAGHVYYPPTLRLRGGLSYAARGWLATSYLNFLDGPEDGRTPTLPASIASWTTVDLQLAYMFTNSVMRGASIALSVQNVFDKDPPFVLNLSEDGVNYDAENATALGRFVSIRFTKKW